MHSEETKRKMSLAMTGLKHTFSPEGLANLIAAARKTHTGRIRPLSTGQRISRSLIGRKHSEDRKEKIRATLLGRKLSVEHRNRISQGVVKHKQAKGLIGPAGFRGTYDSPKSSLPVWYRSSYELQFMQLMDADPNVLSYCYEAVVIGYTIDGALHRYIPDFVVQLTTGVLLVEVRPRNLQLDAKSIAKFSAARLFCQTAGWTFATVSREDMRSTSISSQARKTENALPCGKVQRLIGEVTQTNKPDTSMGHPQMRVEDIVRHSEETRRATA